MTLNTFAMVVMLFQSAQGQGPAVKAVQFKAAIKTVLSNSAHWQKTIDDVDIDSLPVAYSAGKVYEQNKVILSKDLQVLVLWAHRMEHEESLYGEVNFLSAVQEFQNQLQQFGSLVLDAGASDKASQSKVNDWSNALETLANTTIDGVYKTAFVYTTDHAGRMDQMCLQKSPANQPSH